MILNVVWLQLAVYGGGIGNGFIVHVIEALYIEILLKYIAYCV